MVGASWVLRDERGMVLLHSTRLFTQLENVDQAKFEVLLWAFESMSSHHSPMLFSLCLIHLWWIC